MAGRIRANCPYSGKVTIEYVPGGGFEARSMVLPQSTFLSMIKEYLDRIAPANIAARRPEPLEEEAPVKILPEGPPRTVRLRRAAAG